MKITPTEWFQKKLDEQGYVMFALEWQSISPAFSEKDYLCLVVNKKALLAFELRYQMWLGAHVDRQTGVLGMVHISDIHTPKQRKNVWEQWHNRILTIKYKLLEELQAVNPNITYLPKGFI